MKNLDLHGLNYDQAKAKTIRFIEKYWNKTINLEIITGHSLIMQKAVLDILNEYELEYRIGDFIEVNNGYITVFMEK